MRAKLSGFVEDKTLVLFTTLVNNSKKLFHLNSLAKSANVPVTSTARIIKRLVVSNFVEEIKIGKISVYKIADNEIVEGLKKLL